MIRYIISIHLLSLIGCGTPNNSTKTIIGDEPVIDTTSTVIEDTIQEVVIEPVIPIDAVLGNYSGDGDSFYAQISHVDRAKEITFVSFNNTSSQLVVPNTSGGSLSSVQLDGFDRDLLLLTAKLKDPNFNKYFLYVQRANEWKPVVNGFAIHKSNITDSLVPFKLNPKNHNEISRHYSVFNLDSSSDLGYTWLLLEESIPILNK